MMLIRRAFKGPWKSKDGTHMFNRKAGIL